jgi:AraC-like DNA-binding protein
MVKKNKRVERMGYKIQVCPLDTFVSGVLLVHYFMTGHKLTRDDLWKNNGDRSKKVNQMPKRTASDLFYIHENHGQHNPYEQELRELEGIRHGDVEALRQSMEETYAGKIGILAKDPLRNQKNIAIGNITQASRAAIDGGVNVEESFSVTDSFIQQVEELDSVPEVEMFMREAKYTYARMVAKENDGSQSDKGKNPLIAGTKEYIYSHLHSAIRIADIAKHLHVNADYLSHLFRTQEGVTIKRYILNEKILRSQNLLRYSDYGVQEIGFYLGFSSQSHFSHVFQEVTKMSPNAYRKKYGSRKWEK